MKFITRLGYYLGGFSVGLILLAVFLGGKKTSCDYGPNSRTIKNIAIKKPYYSEVFMESFNSLKLDSTELRKFVVGGKVDFSNSKIGKDSCNTYLIENHLKDKLYILQVQNCDSVAHYLAIEPKID